MDDSPIAFGLPHREPFIFIDRVLEVAPGRAATCQKVFAASEPFFRGHFPGDPLVPGVLLTEALAQAAGIAAGRPGAGGSYRLSAIRQMKFLSPARAGDEIILTAEKTAEMAGMLQFAVAARVGGETIAEGIIVLSELKKSGG